MMRSVHFFVLAVQLSISLFADIRACCSTSANFVHVWNKTIRPNTSLPEFWTRIHGGSFAEEHQFKYMVFLLISPTNKPQDKVSTCTASLIHEQWVLTAAHCVTPKDNSRWIIAVAGKADLRVYVTARLVIPFDEDINDQVFQVQERRPSRVYVHPKYTSPDNGADLALLFFDKPFVKDHVVGTLPLSKKRMSVQMYCTVLGWGLNEYDIQTFRLMYADQVSAQTPEIKCSYKKWGPFICLKNGGGGICRGDSGSPLVCHDAVWGVASFSVSETSYPSCLEQQEEYFSQVYPYISWINDVMEGNNAGTLPYLGSLGIFLAVFAWIIV